jgi:predicted nuclease with TOPRIM domain
MDQAYWIEQLQMNEAALQEKVGRLEVELEERQDRIQHLESELEDITRRVPAMLEVIETAKKLADLVVHHVPDCAETQSVQEVGHGDATPEEVRTEVEQILSEIQEIKR